MMNPMNQAVRDNFAKKVSYVARRVPTMTVTDTSTFTAVDCGLPSDTFNVIVAGEGSSPHHLLEGTATLFTQKQLPLALWSWEDDKQIEVEKIAALTAYGLSHTETHVAMVADLSQIRTGVPTPAGLVIQPVTQAEALRRYGGVIAGLFGSSDEGR